MEIKIGVIEDHKTELNLLTKALQEWSHHSQTSIHIQHYSSGEEFFQLDLKPDFDLFFLDIQLDGMDGIAVSRRLRAENFSGHIIFLTAFREYVFQGYQVRALNYLLKPINLKSLKPCLDEIAKDLSGNLYVFRNKQEIIQIPYNNILAFSSSIHYVDILTSQDTYCQYTTLNSIIGYLPAEFIRCHRSYIVNMYHIYKITGNTITLSNQMHVTIGRSYLENVRSSILEYSNRFGS